MNPRPPRTIHSVSVSYSVAHRKIGTSGSFTSSVQPNIVLRRGMSPTARAFVLMHELGHAMEWEHGLPDGDDKLADAFAHFATQLIVSNPKLVAYLQSVYGNKKK